MRVISIRRHLRRRALPSSGETMPSHNRQQNTNKSKNNNALKQFVNCRWLHAQRKCASAEGRKIDSCCTWCVGDGLVEHGFAWTRKRNMSFSIEKWKDQFLTAAIKIVNCIWMEQDRVPSPKGGHECRLKLRSICCQNAQVKDKT